MSKVVSSKNTSEVKYRRPLNKQQLTVLGSLYWYRFCTSKQLAISLDKSSHKTIQNKLQILEAQGLIGKRYGKSYKLAGRPAEYFITPKGARALENAFPGATNTRATRSLYKNQTVSDDFVKHTALPLERLPYAYAISTVSKKPKNCAASVNHIWQSTTLTQPGRRICTCNTNQPMTPATTTS